MFKSLGKFVLNWRALVFVAFLLLPGLALAQEIQNAPTTTEIGEIPNSAGAVDAAPNTSGPAVANPAEILAASPEIKAVEVAPDSTKAAGVNSTAAGAAEESQPAGQEAGEPLKLEEQLGQAEIQPQVQPKGPAQQPIQQPVQQMGQQMGQQPDQPSEDPLSLWVKGPNKQAIIAFVQAATTPGAGFIEPENRIAAFDHDGTLAPEYPAYFQLLYGLERLKAAAPNHPEWQGAQIYKELLAGDLDKAIALNSKKVLEILIGITAQDSPQILSADVAAWLKTSYPDVRFEDRNFSQMAYAPMLELLAYLKANNFKIYLVTGSEVEFSRALAAELYGIPPDQVIGSQLRQKFKIKDGTSQLVREARLDMINDGRAKPENLQAHLGRAPVIAFGNSDGDLPMLQWVTSAPGPRLGLILHHTDAKREYAYNSKAKQGKLRKALEQAKTNKWIVVDMTNDWEIVFAD